MEHLGSTDKGVITYRRLLRKGRKTAFTNSNTWFSELKDGRIEIPLSARNYNNVRTRSLEFHCDFVRLDQFSDD
jgi:hypothetical protein